MRRADGSVFVKVWVSSRVELLDFCDYVIRAHVFSTAEEKKRTEVYKTKKKRSHERKRRNAQKDVRILPRTTGTRLVPPFSNSCHPMVATYRFKNGKERREHRENRERNKRMKVSFSTLSKRSFFLFLLFM